MTLVRPFLLLLVLCSLASPLWGQEPAKKKKKIKIDRLALAAVLLRDGLADRARLVLSKVKLTDKDMKKKKRKVRYHMLFGIIYTKLNSFSKAIFHYEAAIELGVNKPLIHLFVAQNYFRLARYKKVIAALDKAPKEAENISGFFLLKAQSYWRLKKRVQAYAVLVKGRRAHPTVSAMLRLQALLLIELKLSKEGYQKALSYIKVFRAKLAKQKADDKSDSSQGKGKKKSDPLLDVYLMYAGAFARARLFKKAQLLLEEARMVAPQSVDVLVQLARVYLEDKRVRTAASILERAAYLKPKLMIEAAELYRRGGMLWRALYLNAQVTKQAPKMRQRLGLFIELKRFEEAAALAPRLSRLGLLRDQKLLYALAYSCFKTGRYKDAKKWLGRLTDRSLFQKAIALRKAMQSCTERKWWCP